MTLGKRNENMSSGESSYLSFAITRLKIGLIEKKSKKLKLSTKLDKNGFPSPIGNLSFGIPNVSRCHQNLTNNVYRIKMELGEKYKIR